MIDIQQQRTKIQIIKKRIDEERLGGRDGDEGRYYQSIKNSIKRDIKSDVDLLLIDIVPKQPISNPTVLEIVLHLQGEFTDTLVLPEHSFSVCEQNLNEIKEFLNAREILQAA